MKKVYFPQFGGRNTERNLVQDLVDEQIKLFGTDVFYVPRKIISNKPVDGLIYSKFNQTYMIEMMFINVEGFGSPSDFISQFGLKINDEVKFVVSRRRWEQSANPALNLNVDGRPNEGDLIYFPLTEGLYEIKYVEKRSPFYQLGDIYFYTLTAEIYELGEDQFDTGNEEIDNIEVDYSFVTTLDLESQRVQATGSSVMSGDTLGDITVTNIGKGYNVPPIVTITPTNGGSGATAETYIFDGSVIDVFVTGVGVGYNSPPSITISPPPMPIDFVSGEHVVSGSFAERGNERTWASSTTSSTQTVLVNGLSGYDPGFATSTQAKYFYWKFEDTRLNYIYKYKGIVSTNITGEFYYDQANSRYVINTYLPTTTSGNQAKLFELSSNVIAEVASWNRTTQELKIMNKTNNFLPEDIIRGVNSNAIWYLEKFITIDNVNSEYDENKYIEDQSDDILDFQESNPFGEFGSMGDNF
jgi:hypothetical protein